MQHDLATLALSGMTHLGTQIRNMNRGATSMEQVASTLVRQLFDQLIVAATGEPACSLVRAYLTMRYRDLDEDLRRAGAQVSQEPLDEDTRCLTLLATAGEKDEWNRRTASKGHRTIPLPSKEMVAQFPMVSQLIVQLGIDVGAVVHPESALILEAERKTYNVFYVEEAKGSPLIPAQDEFVIPRGIRSVVGFGGMFATGDMFAVLLFAKVHFPRSTADMFRNAAMNAKLALLPFCRGPIFAPA